MRYSKNSSRPNHSDILISSPTWRSDIQIYRSTYGIRNCIWAARCTDIVRYVQVVYIYSGEIRGENLRIYSSILYIAHVCTLTFLAFLGLSALKTYRLPSLRKTRGSARRPVMYRQWEYYVSGCRESHTQFLPVGRIFSRHLAASYVHHGRWIRFLSRTG